MFLVVYFHWGVSGQYEVCQYQTTLGRLAISAGADLVVGSHPHVVQAVEIYKGKPIFYSLGNFLSARILSRHEGTETD